MKTIEIQRVLKKYFQKFMTDHSFTLEKDMLYSTNSQDMLLGFCFDKSGFVKEGVYVHVFVQPYYIKLDHVALSFGGRLEGRDGDIWLFKNNPKMEATVSELIPLMEDAIGGFLNKVNTPLKFYDYYKDERESLRTIEAVVYSALYAKKSNAVSLVDNFIKKLKTEDLTIDWIKNILLEMEALKLILDENDKIEDFFKQNISFTKRELGIPDASINSNR